MEESEKTENKHTVLDCPSIPPFPLEELSDVNSGRFCTFLDTSKISSEWAENPPFWCSLRIRQAFSSQDPSIHVAAQAHSPHVLVSTSSEALLAKISSFFEELLAKLAAPVTERKRFKLSNVGMIHKKHLKTVLSKFGEVVFVSLYGKKINNETIFGHFGETVLRLPKGKTLPATIPYSYGHMSFAFSTESVEDKLPKGKKKKQRKKRRAPILPARNPVSPAQIQQGKEKSLPPQLHRSSRVPPKTPPPQNPRLLRRSPPLKFASQNLVQK